MQPPRSRTPRLELGDTETIRSVILNLTAAAVTLLLLRVGSLLVVDPDVGTIQYYIQLVTEPIVWPFQFIPLMRTNLIQHVTVIDVLMVVVVGFTGLFVAGILAGWRDSQATPRRYDTREE
ncbi:MAG: hypothetical protein WD401_00060 [Thermomicrobiaceae bacterium]